MTETRENAGMFVVGITNGKGGVGKTTTTVNLARELQLRGFRVGVFDTDPAASSLEWICSAREDGTSLSDTIQVRGLTRPVVDKQVRMVRDCDILLIDGAAKADDMTASIIRASDLVVVPVRPSGVDLRQTRDVVAMIQRRQESSDMQARFLISQSDKRTMMTGVIRELLDTMGLPTLNARMDIRADYATTAFYGSTVVDDVPRSSAADEVRALADEIMALRDGTPAPQRMQEAS